MGQIGSDTTAIFQKIFSGEVLAAYKRANIMEPLHTVRSIKNGKSASFPAHGRVNAAYHTPGTTLVGQSVTNGERVITVDGVLVADVFMPSIDEAMAHYDVRAIYATEQGQALARAFDLNVFRVALLAARGTAAALPGGETEGASIVDADLTGDGSPLMTSEGDAMAEAIFKAGVKLDEKFVPDEGRVAILRPLQYANVVQGSSKAIDVDFNPGGNGSYASGKVKMINNIVLLKSNNLPRSDETDGTDEWGGSVLAKYQLNSTNTRGLVFHRSAVGTVKLMDLAMRADYMPRELGYFTTATMAVGHGILRGAAAVELKTS